VAIGLTLLMLRENGLLDILDPVDVRRIQSLVAVAMEETDEMYQDLKASGGGQAFGLSGADPEYALLRKDDLYNFMSFLSGTPLNRVR